jgi:sugar fermentation stimulation protein A
MQGISEPGRTVMLSDSGLETRRNRLTWELLDLNGMWVGVNTAIPLKVLVESIKAKAIPSLTEFGEPHVDVRYGHGNRIDVMLEGMEQNCFIDAFHVSWVENGVAMFPEVPSPRVTKSFQQLTEIAQQGHRAVAFFLVQRSDATLLRPVAEAGANFLNAMRTARDAGVQLAVYQAIISLEEITLGPTISCSLE